MAHCGLLSSVVANNQLYAASDHQTIPVVSAQLTVAGGVTATAAE